jgi:REP element-mobilizing transposase RayT
MPFDPQRHRRRSIRLKRHDYCEPGAYYVTICVLGRERILSRVRAGQVDVLEAGAIVEQVWQSLPAHFDHVTLDAFVVMPDHVHGIVVLSDSFKSPKKPATQRANGTQPGSLAAIVQNFKSVSARRINQARGTSGRRVWQEDYYEHIVRDADDMDRIRRYIAANPSRWHDHR